MTKIYAHAKHVFPQKPSRRRCRCTGAARRRLSPGPPCGARADVIRLMAPRSVAARPRPRARPSRRSGRAASYGAGRRAVSARVAARSRGARAGRRGAP